MNPCINKFICPIQFNTLGPYSSNTPPYQYFVGNGATQLKYLFLRQLYKNKIKTLYQLVIFFYLFFSSYALKTDKPQCAIPQIMEKIQNIEKNSDYSNRQKFYFYWICFQYYLFDLCATGQKGSWVLVGKGRRKDADKDCGRFAGWCDTLMFTWMFHKKGG